jgi:hypothetical protein
MHTPMIDFLAEQYAKGENDQAYDKLIAIRNRASPTGKMGTGWDTANATLFFASDEAAANWITAARGFRPRQHTAAPRSPPQSVACWAGHSTSGPLRQSRHPRGLRPRWQ